MNAPLTDNTERAHRHLFAQFNEVFGSHVCANRPLRLNLLSLVTGHKIDTTKGWTEHQYRWTANRLRELSEEPDRASRLLQGAAAELAPDVANVAAVTDSLAECGRSRAELSDIQTALALLERIGEMGHDGRFACGDAGLILCAMNPEATRREVLAEHLKAREMDQLRAFLCPSFPPSGGLSLEDALRFEQSAVRTWLDVCRVAERVTQEIRDTFVGIGWGFFHAAASASEIISGKPVPPSKAEICRRLAAVSDAEHVFLRPADLRAWIRSGSAGLPERLPTGKPDALAESYEHFKARFHELDNAKEAWVETFGNGGAFSVKARGKR